MAYTDRTKIDADLGAAVVLQALDRDRDGIEDDGVFAELQSLVDDEVDALLEGAFETPFTAPYPKSVTTAAHAMLCARLAKSDKLRQDDARAAKTRLVEIAIGDEGMVYSDDEPADEIDEPDGDWDLDDQDSL